MTFSLVPCLSVKCSSSTCHACVKENGKILPKTETMQETHKQRGTFMDDGIMLGWLPDESPRDLKGWTIPIMHKPVIEEETIVNAINTIKSEIVNEFGPPNNAYFLTWYVKRGTRVSQTIVEQIKEIDNTLHATIEYYDDKDAVNEILIVSSQCLEEGSSVLEEIRRSMRERVQI